MIMNGVSLELIQGNGSNARRDGYVDKKSEK